MTDFNKGDFTQQGVNGHVNAKLRLNGKRYLDIDLTSNEQASGCTISGHVYDSLNNITYPIGSAPSGNIEITENTTEPLNIAPYATATVNVPQGGDYVYIVNETVNLVSGKASVTVDTSQLSPNDALLGVYIINNEPIFMLGNYVYDSEEEQALEFIDRASTSRMILTNDGTTWEMNWSSQFPNSTCTIVVIKMPDFYSA